MDSTDFYLRLRYLNACTAAQDWVRAQLDTEKTAEGVWNKCDRPDWLLWLSSKLNVNRRFSRAAAVDAIRLHGMVSGRDVYFWEWLASACARGASREIDRDIRPISRDLAGFVPSSVLNATLDHDYGYIVRRLTDGWSNPSYSVRADFLRKYIPWRNIEQGLRRWEL